MIAYILRRLGWSVLTVFGVMLITFVLFRAMPGDIAAAHVGQKARQQDRAEWLNRHGYDRPSLINRHKRLVVVDKTTGIKPLGADDDKTAGSQAADALALFGEKAAEGENADITRLLGRFVKNLDRQTPLSQLTRDERLKKDLPLAKVLAPPEPASQPTTQPAPINGPVIIFSLRDGARLKIDLTSLAVKKKDRFLPRPNATCGDLIDLINDHPENKGRLNAGVTDWGWTNLFDSQFVDHMKKSVTFDASSLILKKKLTEIIAERAPDSLALTVPAMAIGWILAMIISSFVAYYRGTILDKVGVFVSVLGMCIPFLAFMIYGQWLMFTIAPTRAYGLAYRSNVYLPIAIMVIAGLGGSVRFYRTVILDQVNRDYVRTARAKGASLPAVLFKHVLKNCMLPILTNLILALPFLIMGSLLVETYFGIPGLGDLLLSSINGRDEPVVNAMVFLTAIIYTTGVMLTDISYALFDPRIRLT
ncbi:MAG: ABC transporter permease subunit [Phycisphaerae bacterium]|jgi:peptide/nickel transport system permease protein|nr:ABC transporter permease subunit [Phycisphaerae bacterium]